MNDFGNPLYFPVAYRKLLAQRFKRAVFSPVPKARCTEHIERNRIRPRPCIIAKHKPCLGINKMPDEPRRRYPVDPGPWPCHPDPVAMTLRFLAVTFAPRRRVVLICLRK